MLFIPLYPQQSGTGPVITYFLQQNIWVFILNRLNKESEQLHIYLGQVLPLGYEKNNSFQDFLDFDIVDKGLWTLYMIPPNIFDPRTPLPRAPAGLASLTPLGRSEPLV